MIRSNPLQRSRLALRTGRLAILALPVALAMGCGDGSSGGGPTATATSPPAATSTATPPATSTSPPATLTSTPPAATSTATPPGPTATATPVPTADANAACAKLAGCDQCFINSSGQCLSTDDCAQRLSADVAICINGVTGCSATTLGDCLFFGCDGNDPSGECQ